MGCLPKTTLVHEDQRLTHFAKRLQDRINKALCGGGDTLDVQWTKFLFVDQNDPGVGTPPGERNYWTNKFETIQDAINAAVVGDVIYISPGTYVGNLDLSDVAPNVTLLGSGQDATIILNDDDINPTISCSPDTMRYGIRFLDLTVINNEGNPAIQVNSQAALDSFSITNGPLVFDMVKLVVSNIAEGTFALEVSYANALLVDHLTVLAGGISLYNVGTGRINDSDINGVSLIDFDLADPNQPSQGRQNISLYNTNMSDNLEIDNQVNIYFNKSCDISSISGALLQIGAGEDNTPSIEFHGKLGSLDMTFGSDAEYLDDLQIANFDEAIIEGAFTLNSTDTNISPWRVSARQALFNDANADSIQCCANIVADDAGRAKFDMLGAEFTQLALNTNNYQVDRTFHYISAIDAGVLLVNPTDNAISIVPPFINSATRVYTVHPDFPIQGSFASMEVDAKTNEGFNCRVDVQCSANFKLILNAIGTNPN